MHGMRLDFREDHAASSPSPFEHPPIQPAGDANDGRRCEGPGTVMNTTEGASSATAVTFEVAAYAD